MVIFSFFSGVGILDLGFQEAGFEIVFVNEYKQAFLDSYMYARRGRNYGIPRYGYHVGDINDFLDGGNAARFANMVADARARGEQIGFIGGPPCPDFSVGGKNKGRDGDNGRLAQSYVNMIVKYQPDFFLFENVKGLIKTRRHREYFEDLKNDLKRNRFVLSEKLVNSLDYGVAQDRERIILIGTNITSSISKKLIFVKGSFAFDWRNGLRYNSDQIKRLAWPSSQQFVLNSKRTFRYDVPKELTVEYWFRRNRVNIHPNGRDVFRVRSAIARFLSVEEGDTSRKSFKRLHRWRFSPTAAYGNNEVHLHPYKARRLSVAEAMAIQSLPEWFELPPEESLTNKFKMIGNGVPFLVSEVIATQILNSLL